MVIKKARSRVTTSLIRTQYQFEYLIGKSTKGIENAKDGAKVTIKYTEKDGQLRASEINPR